MLENMCPALKKKSAKYTELKRLVQREANKI